MSAISDAQKNAFVQVVETLMSNNNAQRSQAEQAYNNYVASSASATAELLCGILSNAPNPVHRNFAAVLLRALMKPEKISTMNEATVASLKSAILTTVRAEPISAQEVGLFLLARIGEYAHASLRPAAEQIFAALGNSLSNAGSQQSADSRTFMLDATSNFLLALEPAQLPACKPLIQPMLTCLESLLANGDEVAAREAIESLIDLAVDPGVLENLGDGISVICNAMLNVTMGESLEPATRAMGLEFICSVADGSPGMVRKMQDLVAKLVPGCLGMIADIEDEVDDSEWDPRLFTPYDQDELDTTDSVSGAAVMAIERLSVKLGGRVILPHAFGNGQNTIPALIACAGDWRRRRAGVLGAAKMGAGCKKMLKPQLPSLLAMVLPRLTEDPNQRVRFSAAVAVAHMSKDYEGDMQRGDAAQQTLAALANAMSSGSGNCPRVRACAANSFISFANLNESTGFGESSPHAGSKATTACTAKVLMPQMDNIVNALVSMLQDSSMHPSVHEEAMSAVSCVATVAQERFGAYYDAFIPAAKNVVRTATAPQLAGLRGKTMETIALIGVAVGAEKFRSDAKEIMQMMLQIGFDEHTCNACARICRAMGQEFIPYLPHVLPPLLATANAKHDFSVLDADDEAKVAQEQEKAIAKGLSTSILDVKGLGRKMIVLNTSVVFEKEQAVRAIFEYVDELEHHMLPFLDDIAKVVLPLVTDKFSPSVREVSVLVLPKLLHAAACGLRDGGGNAAATQNLLETAMAPILTQLQKEVNREVLLSVAEAASMMMRVCYESGGMDEYTCSLRPAVCKVPPKLAQACTHVFAESAKQSAARRVEKINEARQKQLDAEDMELLEEELEEEDELLTNMVDSIGFLLKQHGPDFLPLFNQHVAPVFTNLLHPAADDDLKFAAICVFDDVMEFCGESAAPHLGTCAATMLAAVTSPNANLRRAAAYGVRVMAAKFPAAFAQVAAPALAGLLSVVTAQDAQDEENIGATENAVCAIGQICISLKGHPSVQAEKILPIWVNCLPLSDDEECAQLANDQLCDFIEKNEPGLVGAQGQNVPMLRNLMKQILSSGPQKTGDAGGNFSTPDPTLVHGSDDDEEAFVAFSPQTKRRMQNFVLA
eukprot:g2975.t1